MLQNCQHNKCFKIVSDIFWNCLCENISYQSYSFSFRGVRPFGVSLLICGWDSDRPYLFQCDPSGAYFAWKATAMGKNSVNGKTFLEKR